MHGNQLNIDTDKYRNQLNIDQRLVYVQWCPLNTSGVQGMSGGCPAVSSGCPTASSASSVFWTANGRPGRPWTSKNALGRHAQLEVMGSRLAKGN